MTTVAGVVVSRKRSSRRSVRAGSSEIAMVRKTRASNRGRAARPGGPFPRRREWAVSGRGVSGSEREADRYRLSCAELGGSSRLPVLFQPVGQAGRGPSRSAGSAATRRSSSRRSVATSPRLAASQALADGAGPESTPRLAGASAACCTTSIRLVAMPQLSRARQTGTSSGRRRWQASSHRSASS